jgi:glucose uptake protein
LAIPTTAFSAQLLLILSFLFLGLWSSTFKLTGNRWRFELFSFDFAFGTLLCALVASYTLGSFGSDLGFSDHLMISSRTSQALALGAGCVFAFGNMLLLSATALLGLSFTYGIATSSALLILAVVEFNGVRALLLVVTVLAAIVALAVEAVGASGGEATLPAASLPILVRKSASSRASTQKRDAGMKNSRKGVIAAILSGLAFGGLFAPLRDSVFAEFGLGPFAGLVMFSAGILLATVCLNFFFMNITVHGNPIAFGAYFRGTFGQHLLGIIGGTLCVAGILFVLVLNTFPPETQPEKPWIVATALGASLLAIVLGLIMWSESAQAPGSVARSVLIGGFSLLVAIGVFAAAMGRTPPPPQPLLQETGLLDAQLPG